MYPSLSKSYLITKALVGGGVDLQIEGEFQLCVEIAVEYLEKAMHEFFQVNVALALQVHYSKEAFADDTRQGSVLKFE